MYTGIHQSTLLSIMSIGKLLTAGLGYDTLQEQSYYKDVGICLYNRTDLHYRLK